MTENECLSKMIAPGQYRPLKPYRGGVIQIWVTRLCNLSCFNCTQGSQLAGGSEHMSPNLFADALESLRGYWGVVGMFGGNPAIHPAFKELCSVLRASWIPREQRGIWSNDPLTIANAEAMRDTFNPSVSNLNVHLSQRAYDLFRQGWPECRPVGLQGDSRHSPVFVAMKDVIEDESKRWELISSCDINQRWSAMVGVFRGKLRAWFCEVAGAQSILHQHEPDYPDTGLDPTLEVDTGSVLPISARVKWWQLPMRFFRGQVEKHCHECGVPLRGYGELSQQSDDKGLDQTSPTHARVYHPKRRTRKVEVIQGLVQLNTGRLTRTTDYLQNAGV